MESSQARSHITDLKRLGLHLCRQGGGYINTCIFVQRLFIFFFIYFLNLLILFIFFHIFFPSHTRTRNRLRAQARAHHPLRNNLPYASVALANNAEQNQEYTCALRLFFVMRRCGANPESFTLSHGRVAEILASRN